MATDVNVKDGSTGYIMGVTSGYRAKQVAVTRTEQAHNIRKEKGFVWHISRTPTGVNDEFGYVKNGASVDLVIDRIVVTDAGAENLLLAVATGTPVGGTAATPTNLYSGSTVTFASINADAHAVEDGVDITGLTLGATLDTIVTGAGTTVERDYNGTVVVPPGTAVCLSAVTGTTAIVADVYVHFASEPME